MSVNNFELRPDDVLYRLIKDLEDVDADLTVAPAVLMDIRDVKKGQSFFVHRVIGGPRGVLDWFCRQKFVIEMYKPDLPTPERLSEKWGICRVSAGYLLDDLGLVPFPEPNGDEIRADGHVNIPGVADLAWEIADHPQTRALTKDAALART